MLLIYARFSLDFYCDSCHYIIVFTALISADDDSQQNIFSLQNSTSNRKIKTYMRWKGEIDKARNSTINYIMFSVLHSSGHEKET